MFLNFKTLFPSFTSIINSLYRSGYLVGGGYVFGEMWGWVGCASGFNHPSEQKSSHCVFIEVHKQLQFTRQAEMTAVLHQA